MTDGTQIVPGPSGQPNWGGQATPYPFVSCGYYNAYEIERAIIQESTSDDVYSILTTVEWYASLPPGFRDPSLEESSRPSFRNPTFCQMPLRPHSSRYALFFVAPQDEEPVATSSSTNSFSWPEQTMNSPYFEKQSSAEEFIERFDWPELRFLLSKFYKVNGYWDSVDINSNGKAEDNEIVDRNDDGEVLRAEMLDFCMKNWDTLGEKVPFFSFSVGNPIHQIIWDERDLLDFQNLQIWDVYAKLAQVLKLVQVLASNEQFTVENLPDGTQESKMSTVLMAALLAGLSRGGGNKWYYPDSLVGSLHANKFDCDVGTHILLAVAYEMGWPVRAVFVPGSSEKNSASHMFARWIFEDGGYVNYDMWLGESLHDHVYADVIDKVDLGSGLYLKNLTVSQLHAVHLMVIYNDQPTEGLALESLDRAIEYDPQFAMALEERAFLKYEMGDYRGALLDYEKLAAIRPNDEGTQKSIEAIKDKLM